MSSANKVSGRVILREKALIFLLLYQKDQSARTQYLTPTGRSIGFVWKLSETLPKGRVSGSYLKISFRYFLRCLYKI
ncbi:hypothetical protein [Leptospira santarosai]|uniref:hypothetical protein n=1 Tax=Leptospira santarosai TaxID=28183 RepID=UPI00138F0064|nr:hypothetical protein [Leptospira santarosai]